MEDYTLIQIKMSKELDYLLNLHMAQLRRTNVKTTKADLIIKLMRIGLFKESRELLNEERAEQ